MERRRDEPPADGVFPRRCRRGLILPCRKSAERHPAGTVATGESAGGGARHRFSSGSVAACGQLLPDGRICRTCTQRSPPIGAAAAPSRAWDGAVRGVRDGRGDFGRRGRAPEAAAAMAYRFSERLGSAIRVLASACAGGIRRRRQCRPCRRTDAGLMGRALRSAREGAVRSDPSARRSGGTRSQPYKGATPRAASNSAGTLPLLLSRTGNGCCSNARMD